MQTHGVPPVTHLRVGRLVALAVGGVALLGVLAWVVLRTKPQAVVTPTQEDTTAWPGWLRQPLVYAAPEPVVRTPPVAVPIDRTPDEIRALQAQLEATKRELEALRQRQQAATPPPVQPVAQPVTHPVVQPVAQPTSAQESGKWQVISRTRKAAADDRRRDERQEDLVHHADWQMPDDPLKTLYMSMRLPVRLLDAVRSDQPGIAIGEMTVPVFDRFGYGQMILDKGTKVIWKQENVPTFGQTVLPLAIVQLELPSGEVWKVKGAAADSEGRTGIQGKVDNHYWKLILATGINAVLSLGVNSLAGTPSSFYADPFQQAARDATSSISQDVRSIVREQLKVPPTIHLKQGELHTVQLLDNISFARQPRTLD